MKKILIICVNYNSDTELHDYIKSLQEALQSTDEIELYVDVVNNGEKEPNLDVDSFPRIKIKIIDNSNSGYLPGLSVSYNRQDLKAFDYVILSNVDLEVATDFFNRLDELKINGDEGWLAPSILSKAEERNKNPKMINRPSKRKIKLFMLIYKCPFLYWLYLNTLYKRKKRLPKLNTIYIYGGHGSFIILTKNFLRKVPNLNYPIFLFGEEQYLAELCSANDLKVKFVPQIRIFDREHTSTSKISSARYSHLNYLAQKYIYKTYYE